MLNETKRECMASLLTRLLREDVSATPGRWLAERPTRSIAGKSET